MVDHPLTLPEALGEACDRRRAQRWGWSRRTPAKRQSHQALVRIGLRTSRVCSIPGSGDMPSLPSPWQERAPEEDEPYKQQSPPGSPHQLAALAIQDDFGGTAVIWRNRRNAICRSLKKRQPKRLIVWKTHKNCRLPVQGPNGLSTD